LTDRNDEIVRLLGEIRDGQRAQLAAQEEALRMQREQMVLVHRQAERAERINDRAEQLQSGGAQLMGVARKALFTVLPILVLLIAYVTWLLFR
jgi:hypothetical protein